MDVHLPEVPYRVLWTGLPRHCLRFSGEVKSRHVKGFLFADGAETRDERFQIGARRID